MCYLCLARQSFLADYGMVWVGETSQSASSVYHEEQEALSSDDDHADTGRASILSKGGMWKPGKGVANRNCGEWH